MATDERDSKAAYAGMNPDPWDAEKVVRATGVFATGIHATGVHATGVHATDIKKKDDGHKTAPPPPPPKPKPKAPPKDPNRFEARIDQGPGVGKGYFFWQTPPGVDALVVVKNEDDSDFELVITRFNEPDFRARIVADSQMAIDIDHIQTVGILGLGGRGSFGKLIVIPNFA